MEVREPDGLIAITRYRVVARTAEHSLVALAPSTASLVIASASVFTGAVCQVTVTYALCVMLPIPISEVGVNMQEERPGKLAMIVCETGAPS